MPSLIACVVTGPYIIALILMHVLSHEILKVIKLSGILTSTIEKSVLFYLNIILLLYYFLVINFFLFSWYSDQCLKDLKKEMDMQKT